MKNRRLGLALRQHDVALRLGVTNFTIINWERNVSDPPVKFWPRIMDFLGYCPYQEARTLGDLLRLHRTHQGLSHRDLARLLGVEAGSVSRWETGERRPRGKWLKAVQDFLSK